MKVSNATGEWLIRGIQKKNVYPSMILLLDEMETRTKDVRS